MGERIRTFIAIELPEEVRRGLARVQGELKRSHPPVRWVAPEKIHVTLKFLGEIPAEQVEIVCQVTDRVAASAAPFELEAAGAGVFPNRRRPRVVWVGVQGDLPALHALQTGLERELAQAGFPEEERPFSPHLTLGRVQDRASPAEARALGEAVVGLEVPSLGRWRVEQVVVMRSDLRPEGPLYTPLRVLRLGVAAS
ncbi:MAG: RNA 2',3'-cyclic phosphodiesterase [Chloroflexia bacterium]